MASLTQRQRYVHDRARKLLDENGLEDWSVRFDRSIRRVGVCHEKSRMISFSSWGVETRELDSLDSTIIHEVAHALAGAARGHDEVWRRTAKYLGDPDPTRVAKGKMHKPPNMYEAHCPDHGYLDFRVRRPQSPLYCKKCSDNNDIVIVQWYRDQKPVTLSMMLPGYVKRLDAVRESLRGSGTAFKE